jgi:hypothetical protein
MMSRDGARTAQPARPEEPPHRLSGEGQRGPRHRAPRTTGGQDRSAGTRIRQRGRPSFTRPKSRAIAAGRVTSSRRMQSTIASGCVIGIMCRTPGHHDVHSVERGSKLSGDGARCQQRLCANQDGCRWRRLGQPCERRRVRPRRNHLQPQRMVEAYWPPSVGPAAERPLTMHTPRQLASSRVPHDSSCGSGGRSAR